MTQLKGLLIDLHGTIHIGSGAVLGTVEAIKYLRQSKFPFLFVTNTTKESRKLLTKRLVTAGFKETVEDEIYTALIAAKNVIQKTGLNPYCLLEDSAMDELKDVIEPAEPKDSVLMGMASTKFTYLDLNVAFRLMKIHKAPLIAVQKTRYYKDEDGLLKLGPGCFVAGLEYSTDSKANYTIGKPEKDFFMASLRHLNSNFNTDLKPAEVMVIGDDIRDDIVGAQKCGFKGALVQTGKYCPEDNEGYDGIKPDMIFPSAADAIYNFLEENGYNV